VVKKVANQKIVHRDIWIQFGVQQYNIEYETAMIFGDSNAFSPCKIGKNIYLLLRDASVENVGGWWCFEVNPSRLPYKRGALKVLFQFLYSPF